MKKRKTKNRMRKAFKMKMKRAGYRPVKNFTEKLRLGQIDLQRIYVDLTDSGYLPYFYVGK